MESAVATHADMSVRYALIPRLSIEGRVSITLQLYRGGQIASTSPIASVERSQAADVMYKCRQHLGRLGVEDLSFVSIDQHGRFIRANEIRSGRLPPATKLVVRS